MIHAMSIFSERLCELMNRYQLTQKELAAKAGVTESAMSYYVKGERTPRSGVLTRMAKALNTPAAAQTELQYVQRNLGKLDAQQLKRAENILKEVFNDIFDDDED